MGLKMALFKFAVHASTEIKVKGVEMFITENIHQNSEIVERSHNPIDMWGELVIFLAPGGQHHSIASH